MLGSKPPHISRLFGASIVGLSLLVAACGGGGDDDTAADDETTTTTEDGGAGFSGGTSDGNATAEALAAGSTWIATVKADLAEVAVYDAADAADASQTLANPNENGTPLTFLIDGADVSGDRLPVLLPVPPTGSTGWVNAADVTLQQNPYRIKVETTAHKLTVTRGEEPAAVVDTTVAVGRDGRETPVGLYFVTELFQPPNPGGDYGPYLFAISSFPTQEEILAEFGEDAVVGIHGTNKPELLGQDVSSGCIRMDNGVITEMAGYIPLGTPVEISA